MSRSLWGQTPRQSIAAATARHGHDAVVAACLDLLAGRDADPALVAALGGPRAPLDAVAPYWLRVWGLRGLLWEWDVRALPAVRGATGDDAWRVREMAAKVVARHRLDAALEEVVALQHDGVARVRVAAARAVRLLTG